MEHDSHYIIQNPSWWWDGDISEELIGNGEFYVIDFTKGNIKETKLQGNDEAKHLTIANWFTNLKIKTFE